VRSLLSEQHPDLADLGLERLTSGWDNEIYRLGATFAVRLPRRAPAVPLILNEQRWLPRLAPSLPVPVPAPVRIGIASAHYPAPWSIVPWLEGESADIAPLDADQAESLAAFLRALHVGAPAQAPRSPYRGVPLGQRADVVEQKLARHQRRSGHSPRLEELWRSALAAPEDTPVTWVHGDLHARNVLVSKGHLKAVIDWGDLCAGDRATDLAAVWMLLDSPRSRSHRGERRRQPY
jgi:aminoglycoside phosphotransferase (APT) family kinase protein